MTPMRASATEKTLHWSVASAVLVLMATGIVMYVPWLSQVVGQRFWVRTSHVIAALLLVAILLVIPALRWSDARRLERELSFWDRFDWDWFRRPWDVFLSVYEREEPSSTRGRFNAGQKLLAALVAVALAVLLASGVPMYWWGWFGGELVQRARDLHVLASLALTALIAGHIYLAAFGPSGLLDRRSEQQTDP